MLDPKDVHATRLYDRNLAKNFPFTGLAAFCLKLSVAIA
jgi:hypothetical protein